ncbi:hypothetical protein T06_16760, partial [Trichinella sp. T6]
LLRFSTIPGPVQLFQPGIEDKFAAFDSSSLDSSASNSATTSSSINASEMRASCSPKSMRSSKISGATFGVKSSITFPGLFESAPATSDASLDHSWTNFSSVSTRFPYPGDEGWRVRLFDRVRVVGIFPPQLPDQRESTAPIR